MKKKIIGILVCLFLLISGFLVSISAMGSFSNKNFINNKSIDGEELDQYQNISDDIRCSYDSPEWYAQSFIPTKSITSKVSIFIVRINCPNNLYVGIKHDLDGDVIVSSSVHTGYIPTTPGWIEIDIPDVYTPLNKPSYIVVTEEGSSPGFCTYQIFGSRSDVYDFGAPFYSHDEGKSWDIKTGDLSFKTYIIGMDTPPLRPTITGSTNGKSGKELLYKFKSLDPDGDDVKYIIDWGDG